MINNSNYSKANVSLNGDNVEEIWRKLYQELSLLKSNYGFTTEEILTLVRSYLLHKH